MTTQNINEKRRGACSQSGGSLLGNDHSGSQRVRGPQNATANQTKKVFSSHLQKWINPTFHKKDSHKPCGGRGCLTCPSFVKDPIFRSSVTGGAFMMTNDGVFTCKTNNVIYLITCTKCSLQYVGKTETPLHKRMNGHRSSCNDVFKNLYLVNHFKQEGHNFGDAHIQIIDHLTHDDNSSLSD